MNVLLAGHLHVVDNAHAGQDEAASPGRGCLTQRLDLIGQAPAFHIIDQRQERITELDLQLVDMQRVLDGGILRIASGGGLFLFGDRFGDRLRCPRCAVAFLRGFARRCAPAPAARQRERESAACRAADRWRAPCRTTMPMADGIGRELTEHRLCRPAPSTPALETSRPAASDTIKAGIWETSPSPMVSVE
jgi:hypothetical protein